MKSQAKTEPARSAAGRVRTNNDATPRANPGRNGENPGITFSARSGDAAQNETPAALASATGAEQCKGEQGFLYFEKLSDTIPLRVARACCGIIGALESLRRGHDCAEVLAMALAKTLGERELTLLADATGMAMHARTVPPL